MDRHPDKHEGAGHEWDGRARSFLNDVVERHHWEAVYTEIKTPNPEGSETLFYAELQVSGNFSAGVRRTPGILSHNKAEARESAASVWLQTFESMFTDTTEEM